MMDGWRNGIALEKLEIRLDIRRRFDEGGRRNKKAARQLTIMAGVGIVRLFGGTGDNESRGWA